MITTYKLLKNQREIEREELYRMGNVTTRRTQTQIIQIKCYTICTDQRLFSNRIVTDWNSLPKDVVEAPTTVDDHWKEKGNLLHHLVPQTGWNSMT